MCILETQEIAHIIALLYIRYKYIYIDVYYTANLTSKLKYQVTEAAAVEAFQINDRCVKCSVMYLCSGIVLDLYFWLMLFFCFFSLQQSGFNWFDGATSKHRLTNNLCLLPQMVLTFYGFNHPVICSRNILTFQHNIQ